MLSSLQPMASTIASTAAFCFNPLATSLPNCAAYVREQMHRFMDDIAPAFGGAGAETAAAAE